MSFGILPTGISQPFVILSFLFRRAAVAPPDTSLSGMKNNHPIIIRFFEANHPILPVLAEGFNHENRPIQSSGIVRSFQQIVRFSAKFQPVIIRITQ
jgi:hypothetical protein